MLAQTCTDHTLKVRPLKSPIEGSEKGGAGLNTSPCGGHTVKNGSAHGVGIYTARLGCAKLSKGFCDSDKNLGECVLHRPLSQCNFVLGCSGVFEWRISLPSWKDLESTNSFPARSALRMFLCCVCDSSKEVKESLPDPVSLVCKDLHNLFLAHLVLWCSGAFAARLS